MGVSARAAMPGAAASGTAHALHHSPATSSDLSHAIPCKKVLKLHELVVRGVSADFFFLSLA